MSFVKNISILVTGTTIAQAIPIAISPILTRIYTPEDFGKWMLYLSIVTIISVVATGRYELAIVQSKSLEEVKGIVFITFTILLIVTVLSFFLVFLYNFFEFNYLAEVEGIYLYFIPISVFFVGIFNILNYCFLYLNKYHQISNSKVYQSIGISFFQILCSIFKSLGLVIGQMIGQFLSVIYMLRVLNKEGYKLDIPKREKCCEYMKNYKDMPCYSMPGAFADNISLQMPIFIINKYFDSYITGIFGLTFRILSLPAALLSRAISQVLYRKINTVNQSENLVNFLIKLFLLLCLLYSPLIFIIWISGEDIFAIIFGTEWRKAGSFAKILVIAVLMRFAVSPLSSIVLMKENIKLGMTWQFLYLMTISIVLLYFSKYSIEDLLWAFVVHEIILYFIYFFIILIGAKRLQEKK